MSRASRILAVALAAIVVLAVVAAVLAANRPGFTVDPASPEATVQAFIRAAVDGRSREAAALLAPGSDCDATHVARQVPTGPTPRVALVRTKTDGDTATVEVRIVHSDASGPLDSTEYTEQFTYQLVRSAGAWRLTGVPWPLYECVKE